MTMRVRISPLYPREEVDFPEPPEREDNWAITVLAHGVVGSRTHSRVGSRCRWQTATALSSIKKRVNVASCREAESLTI